ncbi:uncharacterized protein Z518_09383 [Rhinocladiella mackenziei CBS 650.93]|uniref:Cupin type-1 domain-containing protein n=1 Tax=Rhinocladiella mackenziei CBS 650.93 TaxID=1442369 RepID=A0A0D2FI27_9EURO|nr:uncharacterized protein Z518_09383 [Rhinocladiella mackenziei CBS 650.93]KIX01657.1 hypothetical protein Z518_09383 [Rhinocladiella mackenziei CBS 650.93]
MRATYKHDHPWCKKGKQHAQSPPLHLHFLQSETFVVLSGELGTTTTYSLVDTIHTPANTGESNPHELKPWTPHTFWPSPDAAEDTVMMVWAHPEDVGDEKMDRLFFQNMLMYVSDVSEGKEKLSLFQVMLMQYVSPLSYFPAIFGTGP